MAIFTAAAVQMCSGTTIAENIAAMETLVREAASRGATYVQTPEMTGALVRDRPALRAMLRTEAEDLVAQAGQRLAGELGITLHIGSTAIALDDISENGKVANRAFLFGPDGARIATYDKIHMFDVDLDRGESWRESATYQPGEKSVVATLQFATLGVAVCYDLRFPQLFQAQALAGAEVLTVPAAFTRQTGEAHWHVLLRSRAIENGAFVIAAAQSGRHQDGRETFGHSMIIDPWGAILAEATSGEPQVITAEIDTAKVADARKKIPNLRNARAFEVARIGGQGQAQAAE
ncbi:carbon-nitrogen hydrolase family protein [Tianweitania populi]|uniref:Amidohydrolase n=1 Tax=Tianweitania populi TaxID=1607949 RepID=A0A8J3DRX8_9HYPH|nr:carbon-nitrogen hydrolase family protein [Tianweitania populi]GHD19026.1 amidohydrolase [Tianweitania populi]